MKKEEFVKIFDDIFKTYSFKKTGNKWSSTSDDIIKTIRLQKSSYGNQYYVNYGYILKNIELNGLEMHVFNGLGSLDEKENETIMELLDIDSMIDDSDRKEELRNIIEKEIILKFSNVNNENDVLNELKNRRNLNDVPLIVKEYFNLPH